MGKLILLVGGARSGKSTFADIGRDQYLTYQNTPSQYR